MWENLLASWRQSGQKQDPCPSLLNYNAKYKRLLLPFVISPTVSHRFPDTWGGAFFGGFWTHASVRKMCPDFFYLTNAAPAQSGHADPQLENRKPDESQAYAPCARARQGGSGFCTLAKLAGDGREREALPVQFQDHHEFPKADHRAAPSRRGEKHR